MDLVLPFGLRSAPYIFNSVTDLVEWILLPTHNVSELLHYIDNFITAGPLDSNQGAQNLATSIAVCHSLGLPLYYINNKCIGPSTRLVVLGIELDSVAQVVPLLMDKLCALQALLQSWLGQCWCSRRELESLIGHLHHAAKVVWPGRIFLHRVINLFLSVFSQTGPPDPSEFRISSGSSMVASVLVLLARHLFLVASWHVCLP